MISGCRDHSSAADGGADASFPPASRPFAGCAAVVRVEKRPVCELGGSARTIRVALPGGLRSIDVPKDADRVSVEGFVLEVRPAKVYDWLDEAKAARAKGDPGRARELVTPHLTDADSTAAALAEGMIARLDLARGRADEAVPHFRAAVARHRMGGRVSDAVDDSFALAFALHQRSRRYDEARGALDANANDLDIYPEGRARDPYYRGILAGEVGDHRGALVLLREASKRAAELGMTKGARNARSSTALEMQEIGRAKEAQTILLDLEKELSGATDATPCERAEIANNVGWGSILLREDARPALERAVAITECKDAYVRGFALGNLARVALRAGDADLAAERLDEAKAAVTEPRGIERIENRILEGRIALARKQDAAALAVFEEALVAARAAYLRLPEWQALTARAEAQAALGKKEDAVRSLLEAERVLEESTLLVPLGEGRGSFVADRSKSAQVAVELLVQLGRAAEAARVARRSRARVLSGVARGLRIASLAPEERGAWEAAVRIFRTERAALDEAAANDWKLPADDVKRVMEVRKDRDRAIRETLEKAMSVLSRNARVEDAGADPPLAAGDLEIVVHPVTDGWTAIARDASGATAYSLSDPGTNGAALGKTLLDPISARIDRARRVRVHAYGAWRNVDVHALPYRNEPLVARVAVDYPVGLGAGRGSTSSDRVLVVGDPNGDLPSARDEARSVAEGFPKERVSLLVRDDATAAKIAEGIRSAGTFHYAGHGIFSGLEGWESALPLASGGRLGVADVIALAPAPARVVLSGCDSAKSEGEAEGLGLAQAFVAAGSTEVLAPIRPVPDDLAAKLASRIHRDNAPLATALRDAIATFREEDPKADWAAFRVLAR